MILHGLPGLEARARVMGNGSFDRSAAQIGDLKSSIFFTCGLILEEVSHCYSFFICLEVVLVARTHYRRVRFAILPSYTCVSLVLTYPT